MRRRSRSRSGGDRVSVGGGLELWCRSVGEGPEVVVVPCCGNADDLAGLCVEGRRVVYYDVRNRGRSDAVADPQRLGFDVEIDDVVAVCDAVGVERCSLLGWSYHSGVVAAFALRHPERVDRLVVAAAIPVRSGGSLRPAPDPAPHEVAHLDQLRAAGLPERDPEAWCEAWRRVYVPLRLSDPAAFDRLASPCAMPNEQPSRVAQAMVLVFAPLGTYDWRTELRGLQAPLLVVHGGQDQEPLSTAEEWVSAVPDGRLLVIDDAAQLPWAEQPDEFFGVANRFLSGRPV